MSGTHQTALPTSDIERREVACSLGTPSGGVAPKGYLTEAGSNSGLRDWYGLTEHESANYPPRTRSNVQQSDGKLVLGQLTGGTKLTVDACLKAGKTNLVRYHVKGKLKEQCDKPASTYQSW